MAANQQPAARHENLRILLAEDNAVNQTVATGLLKKMGHTVVMADDGKEALALLAARSFDLVLMDVQMPIMDGVTATKKIREIERGKQSRMPIIAVTACVMNEDRERCLAAGMDGYVTKPIDQLVLNETIEKVLTALEAKFAPETKTPEMTQEKDSLWDVTQTLAAFGGDEKMLRTVVAQYLKSIPTEMAELRQAVLKGSVRDVASTTHCLKGEIGYLAIKAFSDPVAELQHMARQGDIRRAARVLAQLEPVVAAVMTSLQRAHLSMEKESEVGELVTK
jgi:two-component system sensor histidine kinase/response regulator